MNSNGLKNLPWSKSEKGVIAFKKKKSIISEFFDQENQLNKQVVCPDH